VTSTFGTFEFGVDTFGGPTLTWTFDQEFTFDSLSYTWDGFYPSSSTSYVAILGVAVVNVSAASAISQFEIFIGYAPLAVTGESISAALQGGSLAPNIMPNLVGLELYPAIALLQQLKIYVPSKIGYFGTFPIKAVFVKSNLPPGTVTAQSLTAGLAAPPNTLITLTVSEFAVSVAFP
jgi:hypothetical protein